MNTQNNKTGLDQVGGLVAQSAMTEQHQLAATEPPSAASLVTTSPENNVPAAAKSFNPAFHTLGVTLMVTLDLTDDRMLGMKDALTRIGIEGTEYNVYSPFRKAGKPTDSKASAEGVLRSAIAQALDLTQTINSSRFMVLGKPSEVAMHIKQSVDAMSAQVMGFVPGTPQTLLAELVNDDDSVGGDDVEDDEEDEEEDEEAGEAITLGDVVQVSSWMTSTGANEAINVHNAIVNFSVSSGAINDSTERVKAINQVETILNLMLAARSGEDQEGFNIFFAVKMSSQSLEDQAQRELLESLLTNQDCMLYSRDSLHLLEESSWAPPTHKSIDRDLMGRADMILMKMLSSGADSSTPETPAVG